MKNQMKEMKTAQLSKQRTSVKEINFNWNFELEKEKREIKGTPFYLIRENNVFFVVIGQYVISERSTDDKGLFHEFKKPTFDNIMRLIGVMFEEHEKFKELEGTIKNNNDEENK